MLSINCASGHREPRRSADDLRRIEEQIALLVARICYCNERSARPAGHSDFRVMPLRCP